MINTQREKKDFNVEGFIGQINIVRVPYETFITTIKEYEWTDNNLYKYATPCEVKPLFFTSNTTSTQKINFNEIYLDESSRYDDFITYSNDMKVRRDNHQEILNAEKNKFRQEILEGANLNDKSEILAIIKKDKKRIISNSNLKDKLGKYLTYLS
jgi:hypothetical protein